MEEKLKLAGHQMRGLTKDCYPPSWEVYVPLALSEYNRYLALYYQVSILAERNSKENK